MMAVRGRGGPEHGIVILGAKQWEVLAGCIFMSASISAAHVHGEIFGLFFLFLLVYWQVGEGACKFLHFVVPWGDVFQFFLHEFLFESGLLLDLFEGGLCELVEIAIIDNKVVILRNVFSQIIILFQKTK